MSRATSEAWPAKRSDPSADAACNDNSAACTAGGGGGAVDVAAGKTVFGSAAASCHTLADAGATGAVGPNLDDAKPDAALVKERVTNGKAPMPAFKGQLADTRLRTSQPTSRASPASSSARRAPRGSEPSRAMSACRWHPGLRGSRSSTPTFAPTARVITRRRLRSSRKTCAGSSSAPSISRDAMRTSRT